MDTPRVIIKPVEFTFTPSRTYTADQLSAKISNEGGITEALGYGVESSQILDPDLSAAWAEVERVFYESFEPVVDRFYQILDEQVSEDE